jgi:hypothetical protein
MCHMSIVLFGNTNVKCRIGDIDCTERVMDGSKKKERRVCGEVLGGYVRRDGGKLLYVLEVVRDSTVLFAGLE